MEKEFYNKLGFTLIKLIKYYLFDKDFSIDEDINFTELFTFSKFHYLSSLCYVALKKKNVNIPEDTNKLFEKELFKDIRLDAEQLSFYIELEQAFKENNLKTMPLKGLHIKHLYPETYLRKMSDLDIYYDKKDFNKIKEVLLNLGTKFDKKTRYSKHQIFVKEPLFDIEMHQHLFVEDFVFYLSSRTDNDFIKENDDSFYMDKNNEFLHLLCHAYQHYHNGGIGIRTLFDFSLYINSYKDELDFEYIDKEVKYIDTFTKKNYPSIYELYNNIINTVNNVIYKDNYEINDFLIYNFSSGVYGTISNSVKNGINYAGSKFAYLIKRIYPPFSSMKQSYHFLIKLPFLLPFTWVLRHIKFLFKNKKTQMTELKNLKK